MASPWIHGAVTYERRTPDRDSLGGKTGDTEILKPGDLVAGQFRITGILGKGGMGVVYEVADLLTRQRLALKTIRQSILRQPGVLDALIHEVSVARQLRHPNIVAVYDVRQAGPIVFYTMELLTGQTLHEYVKSRAPVSIQEAVAILTPLCLALEHAHLYTVHRDISPENIMLVKEGVKLLDFGVATALDAHGMSFRARGKEIYAAPEQRDGKHDVDIRADIYPLGVMFHELLTGKTLKKPVTPGALLKDLTPECSHVINHSAVVLEHRFRNVAEFREDLGRCVQALQTRPPAERVMAALTTHSPQAGAAPVAVSHWARWLMAGLAILLIAVTGVMGWPVIEQWAMDHGRPAPLPSTLPPSVTLAQPVEPLTTTSPAPWETSGRDGKLILARDTAMDFVRIRPGSFTMGRGSSRGDDASPPRVIQVVNRYWLGAREITQAQWQAVMHSTPWRGRPNVTMSPQAPAVYISWNMAVDFIEKLNSLGAGTFRLPTEAEWEYACRAGSAEAYSFGPEKDVSQLEEHAWFFDNTEATLRPYAQDTGTLKANTWGLWDMHGNAAEWCEDWYDPGFYAARGEDAALTPVSGREKVIRGGGWRDRAAQCMAHRRQKSPPDAKSPAVGFRVARDQ